MKTFNHKDIKDIYSESDYFNVINLEVNLKINNPGEGRTISYELKEVILNSESYSGENDSLREIEDGIKALNNKITTFKEKHQREWNLFYLYKDIFQMLNSKDFNYYRGQATNWKMLPGVLRDNIDETFINNFETTYQDIMYKYPDIINYITPVIDSENITLREQELAHLQHYGFQSSLIDITENPYIALLFMVSDTSADEFNSGVIDAFSIDLESHMSKNLFSKVKLVESNKRIIAQKGAFLNFEKIVLNNLHSKIDKIPLVRITLKYDFPLLINSENELEKLKKEYHGLAEEVKNLEKISDTTKHEDVRELNRKYILVMDKRHELRELRAATRQLKKFFNEYFLNSIRVQINNKLEEFHYVENDLFPDFYKYISYIKTRYDTIERTGVKPDLEKGYELQKDLKNML